MAGTPKPIGRILIIPKGNYDLSTPYNSLDLVRYDSKSWLCKTDGIIGITPTEGTDWTLMTEDGTDGRGIVDIQRTGTDPSNPLKDIYTITYTDGTTSTFTVTNGSGGGTTADTMLESVYDKDDDGIVDKADIANTATNATDATNAKNVKKSDGTTISADSINTKLSKLNSDGTLDFSNVGSKPTTLSGYGITDAYTKSNTYSKTEVDNKLDSWFSQTQQATATGEQNVVFTGLDTTKAYELWFETTNGSQVSVKSSSLSGTTMTYVINIPTDCPVPVNLKLRVIK